MNITFIFDRWRRSSAAVTPVKYECDSRNITDTFARSEISLTEKLTNGALVTPTPDLLVQPLFYFLQIEGTDEDNARVVIKLTLSGEKVTIAQAAVKAVSRKEYDKYSKYLSK